MRDGEKPRLEALLVCPYCKEELQSAADRFVCTTCERTYPVFSDGCVDTLATLPQGWDEWQHRVDDMTSWYQALISDPAWASSCFSNDYRPFKPILAHLSGTVLDLGGGNGVARHFVSPEVRYVVVDPSLDWLQPTWTTLADDFPCLEEEPIFVRGVGEHLPFRSSTFDAVLSLWSLNHVKSPEAVVSEAARVLKPGGTFLVVLEDMQPTLQDLFRLTFHRRAAHQVAEVIRSELPDWCAVQDRLIPLRGGRNAAAVVAGKLRYWWTGEWPVQSDHLYIQESDIANWSKNAFEVARREWISHYLTYELMRKPNDLTAKKIGRG